MEKKKEFLTSPKKTAILGLIGGIVMLIYPLVYSFSRINLGFLVTLVAMLAFTHIIGLIIYFIIILLRLYKQKGNIKVANYILIISYVLAFLYNPVVWIANGEFGARMIIEAFMQIIVIIYFINILLRKTKLINNKIFAITVIGYSILQVIITIIDVLKYSKNSMYLIVYLIMYLIMYLGYILVVPYFYNYYNLLKEEKSNGK